MTVLSELLAPLVARAGVDLTSLDPASLVAGLDDATVEKLLDDIEREEERAKYNRFFDLFPDETHEAAGRGTMWARRLYPKHLEHFRAGATHTERLFMAANRIGKTVAGAYECCAHATGDYPHWWEGKRFARATSGWAAGDTNETTRDIIQKELFGEVTWDGNTKTLDGSGMIPRDRIGEVTWKRGVADLADIIKVKHNDGKWSRIALKSYDQGRRVFQGTAKHWIWLDEECPLDVYGECQMRLMTTRGILVTTFTPLLGMSETVMAFLPDGLRPNG